MSRDAYLPPAGFVQVPTGHPLEVSRWRAPAGWHHVELVDESEATWQRYCAELAERSRAALQSRRHRESQILASFVTADWNP